VVGLVTPSKPVGHTRHSRHAGHTTITPEVTGPRTNLSGTLHPRPRTLASGSRRRPEFP